MTITPERLAELRQLVEPTWSATKLELASTVIQRLINDATLPDQEIDALGEMGKCLAQCADIAQAAPALVARIRELEGALKPFAEYAPIFAALANPALPVLSSASGPQVTVTDLRRAATAYKGEKG